MRSVSPVVATRDFASFPFVLLATILPLLLLAGCNGTQEVVETPPANRWQGTIMEDGGTRTIRNTAGAVWNGDGRLVEEVVIGTELRGENDLLAAVQGFDFWDGRIYVADRILHTIRVYDLDGNHLEDIGRKGQGPGEFGWITDVGIDRGRGELVVKESTGVIQRLTLSGEFRHRSPMGWNMGFARAGMDLRVTREGLDIFPQMSWEYRPGQNPRFQKKFYLYTQDAAGNLLDSVKLNHDDDQPYTLKAYQNTRNQRVYRPQTIPFAPRFIWNVGWDGSIISGKPEEYRFEIAYPDGRKTVIERVAEAVSVDPEEKRAHTHRVTEILRDVDPRWEWEGPQIPDNKAWYDGIIPDRSGRIWVLREGPGHVVEGWTEPEDWRGWTYDPQWVSELWFEVFDEETGKYLGRVRAPEGMDREVEPFIDGDVFLCLTKGEYDQPLIHRYRLEVPGPTRVTDNESPSLDPSAAEKG